MGEQAPWTVSPKAKSPSEIKKSLENISWDQQGLENPIDLIYFLNKFYKVWPFKFVSLGGKSCPYLKLQGKYLSYNDIYDFMLDEIELAGNDIVDIDLSPVGFSLMLLKGGNFFTPIRISICKDSHLLIDLHLFKKRSVLGNLHLLTKE
jgi:hypothetical protein